MEIHIRGLATVFAAMKRRALPHVLAYIGLTVILTAGAAQSLSGSNTVFSDDIASGQVRGSDLAADSVSGSKIYPNSITGSDVNEASLAAVCPAGMTRVSDLCYGDLRAGVHWSTALLDCGNENLRLPSPSEGIQIVLDIDNSQTIWTNGIYKNHAEPKYYAFRASDEGVGEQQIAIASNYTCMTTVGARP